MLFLEIGAALFCPYLTIYVIIDHFKKSQLNGTLKVFVKHTKKKKRFNIEKVTFYISKVLNAYI
jgi:hypothetical protein